MDSETWVFSGLLVFAVLAIVLIIVAGIKEDEQWNEFFAAHQCKVVGEMSASVGSGFGTTIGANGQVGFGPTIVTVPGKTGYLCDDGVTYWR